MGLGGGKRKGGQGLGALPHTLGGGTERDKRQVKRKNLFARGGAKRDEKRKQGGKIFCRRDGAVGGQKNLGAAAKE